MSVKIARFSEPWERYIVRILLFFAVLSLPLAALADWPTYRHDNARSGMTPDTIDAPKLRRAWEVRTGTVPQTAWSGAAKYDAFGNVPELKSMRNYDPVFHPAIAEGRVYFGSSVDQAVHCLDLATGKERWTFTTNGPVRIAPTYRDGKLYFGSDDGYMYCVSADRGELAWRFSPKEPASHVIHEGNLISQWPCRTGVIVDGDIAYAAFSLFPWQPSYLVGLNAQSGKPGDKGTFVREHPGLTLEGPMLASQAQLIGPQGRVAPLLFRRADGQSLGSLPGGGGCMVLLGGDGRVFHGPGNKRGEIYVSQSESRAHLASYPGATAMVVDDGRAYVLNERELNSAATKAGGPAGWKSAVAGNLELIMAGEYLFVGGRDMVAAIHAADGKQVWQADVQGRAYGLAASDGKLVVSTDEGNLYCFASNGSDVEKPDASPEVAVDAKPTAAKESGGAAKPFVPEVGPYLQFVGPTTAVVQWQTAEATPSLLYLLDGSAQRVVSDPTPKTEHRLELTGLRKDVLYHYQIIGEADGVPVASPRYECDMFFNHFVGRLPTTVPQAAETRDDLAALADKILSASGITQGICLDLGCEDGALVEALARRSLLRVIGIDDDPAKVAAARKRLQAAGLYGTRAVVYSVDSLTAPLVAEQSVDLIVSSRLARQSKLEAPAATLFDMLRPGGIAVLTNRGKDNRATQPDFQALFASAGASDLAQATLTQDGHYWKWRREIPAEHGVWTHQYGTEDNSAYGGESLQGTSSADELRVQWFGRPGPRAQVDRNGRKPSPLAAGGRLFAQGHNRITALNAYNGTHLWTLEVPNFERYNIPRDSGNWCADDSHVYAVVRDRCWKIRATDGVIDAFIKVLAGPRTEWSYDWGYIARTHDVLLGSSVKAGTRHSDFWGGAGWYDDKFGAATFKICSDRLFALDPSTGGERWSYSGALVLNSTITVAADRVYFVESRHPKALATESHRVGLPELWLDQFLVALDVRTGSKIWEQPIDTADGAVMFHLAANQKTLVLVSSDYRYNAYAFDAADGKPLWTQQFDWQSDNHGGHMSRPAIVGDKLFIRPRVLDLHSGKMLPETMPGGGCGSYAATDKSLIFRAGNVTMWDMENSSTTSWSRLRPDCWISTIPASGLLLSPEGGGGCSCGSWLETSIAFIPDRFPPPKLMAPAKFIDQAEVKLAARGTGGVVRYTLDGRDPGAESPLYDKPIELHGTTLVKARTFWPEDGNGKSAQSSVISASLVRDYPAPLISPRSIPFIDELNVQLKLPGQLGDIRFTTDGTEPTADSKVYQSPVALAATTTLKARIAYEDGTLSPIATAEYKKIDAEMVEAVEPKSLAGGLVCQCYEGNWKLLPDFTKLTPKKLTTVTDVSLAPRTANDAFGLRFVGYLKVPVDGVYLFYTRSDDGSRLWIGDRQIVNNDGIHDIVEKSGWVALKAGLHPITIEYWDAVWGQFLEVAYEGPDIPRQPLPATALFHEKTSDKK